MSDRMSAGPGARFTAATAALTAAALCMAAAAAAWPASAASEPPSDIPAKFVMPTAQNDYVKRVVMIPMRDGVRLYTVIIIPKGARNAPIILTRTPYNAASRASNDN
ncbi:MAG TPA: CocE/NonD family hydrolase, partial [Steroidobacteraceae bacterium]|nr:CocE/NonD family hydrolase [Steroidobacteraceae bacterium]